jgi:hypothetical protein
MSKLSSLIMVLKDISCDDPFFFFLKYTNESSDWNNVTEPTHSTYSLTCT